MHWPLRLLETGSTEVKVLFTLANQVFLLLSAISSYFPNNAGKIAAFKKYFDPSKSQAESGDSLLPLKHFAIFLALC